MDLQLFAQQTQQSQVIPFAAASNPRPGVFQVSGGGSTTATYTPGGEAVEFDTKPGDLGLSESILIRVYGTITPTLGSGAAVWSVMESFFKEIKIKRGDTTIKSVHPFFFKLRNQIMRRGYEVNGAPFGGTNFFADTNLPHALPTITGAAAIDFVWGVYIPTRWLRSLLNDMYPVGDSDNPLKIELTPAGAAYGVDPQNNPVIVSGGATVAFSANIAASYIYRSVLSYTPGAKVGNPTVGRVLRVGSSTQSVVNIGAETTILPVAKKPTTLLVAVFQDGNANAAAAAGVNGTGLSTTELSQLEFVLSTDAKVLNLDATEKFIAYLENMRLANGLNFPDGVFPLVFPQQSWGSGFFDDPNLEPLAEIPDFSIWREAFLSLTVASGTTLNSAGAGLARVVLYQEWIESVSY